MNLGPVSTKAIPWVAWLLVAAVAITAVRRHPNSYYPQTRLGRDVTHVSGTFCHPCLGPLTGCERSFDHPLRRLNL
jgi:hypothetical protein